MPVQIRISQYLLDVNHFVAVFRTETIAKTVAILTLPNSKLMDAGESIKRTENSASVFQFDFHPVFIREGYVFDARQHVSITFHDRSLSFDNF